MKILGISGSLRKASWNTAALRAVATMLPEHVTLELAGIGDLPLMNQDLEQNGKYPEPVLSLIHIFFGHAVLSHGARAGSTAGLDRGAALEGEQGVGERAAGGDVVQADAGLALLRVGDDPLAQFQRAGAEDEGE